MNKKMRQALDFYKRMSNYGVSEVDADALRRIEMTLHRWAEHECNGDIERDETTNKTYNVYGQDGPGKIRRFPCADREAGALKRLAALMQKYPQLVAYHQGDPRGCALYLVPKDKLAGKEIDSYYSSYGVAVCY